MLSVSRVSGSRKSDILVQHETDFLGAITYREVSSYNAQDGAGTLAIQDHGDTTSRVSFRNILGLPVPKTLHPLTNHMRKAGLPEI